MKTPKFSWETIAVYGCMGIMMLAGLWLAFKPYILIWWWQLTK